MPHQSLTRDAADLIGGAWIPLPAPVENAPGAVVSRNPARPREVVWGGQEQPGHVDAAVRAAREAQRPWARAGHEARVRVLREYQAIVRAREGDFANLIRDEVGKASWDARAEAQLLAAKVDVTLDASEPAGPMRRVAGFDLALSPTRTGRCAYRPHGVMAVIGPFNFPAHLPNGHIVPALLMGNTVVLKPSDKAPGVGQLLGECLHEALRRCGAPMGVVSVVQGGGSVASALAGHDDIDGVLFTGSWPVGRRIMEANLSRPGRLLALEMGGNNACVVMPDADLHQALVEIVRSAFITTGQRCTCTRRLIVHEAIAGKLVPAVCKAASQLIIGDPSSSHPVFMGPLISAAAREGVLAAADRLGRVGDVLVPAQGMETQSGGWFVTPGVVRVERFVAHEGPGAGAGADEEVFGPFLRIEIVPDRPDAFDHALEQANATRYGLAASIFTRDEAQAERFLSEARAGCVNVNTGTAGASGRLPFGGLGLSGNHRPAGAFSLDYCAVPVGSMIEPAAPPASGAVPAGMRVDAAWVR